MAREKMTIQKHIIKSNYIFVTAKRHRNRYTTHNLPFVEVLLPFGSFNFQEKVEKCPVIEFSADWFNGRCLFFFSKLFYRSIHR